MKKKKQLTCSEAGKKGSKIRHDKTKKEESEIARRAAATRLLNDPDAFKKMGVKGNAKRNSLSKSKLSEIARRAAATRLRNDPNAFRKLGAAGGNANAAKKLKS